MFFGDFEVAPIQSATHLTQAGVQLLAWGFRQSRSGLIFSFFSAVRGGGGCFLARVYAPSDVARFRFQTERRAARSAAARPVPRPSAAAPRRPPSCGRGARDRHDTT